MSRPPAEGLLFPPFQSLFAYSQLLGKQSRRAAHTPCSTLDEFFLYSKKAVVFGHPFTPRKTPQLDKPGTESNSLKGGGGITYFKQWSSGLKQSFRTAPVRGSCEGVFSSGSKVACWQAELGWPEQMECLTVHQALYQARECADFTGARPDLLHPVLGGRLQVCTPSHFIASIIFPGLQFCLF